MSNMLKELFAVIEERDLEVQRIDLQGDDIVINDEIEIKHSEGCSYPYMVKYRGEIDIYVSLTTAMKHVAELLSMDTDFQSGDTVEAYGEHYILIPIGMNTSNSKVFQLFNLRSNKIESVLTKVELATNGYTIVERG